MTGAGTETFGYDLLDRLTAHAGDLGTFTLGYLGQTGQITARSLTGSLLATSWGYLTGSGDRRLASVATTGLASGQSTGFAYTTNAEALITGTTQTTDGSAAYPAGAVAQTGAYSQLNQLTNLTGQHLTWDTDGNLLSDGVRTYSWDAENRLVAIAYTGVSGKATSLAYDGLGRRIQIASTPAGGGTATTTNYVWCGSQLCQARTAAGAEARGYYAEGEFMPGSPPASLYYAPDNLGSVRRVFAASQAPSYDYDPYGAPNQATAPVTDFAYAGMVYNADSGFYLTTRRPYDPVTGRFLSRDPIGERGDPEGNLYAYVGGDPVDLSDPLGLQEIVLPGLLPEEEVGPVPAAPFLPENPYSPESVSGRQSGFRDDLGLNRDPDSPIPNDPYSKNRPGGPFDPSRPPPPARPGTPHSTGERNVNPNEEHSMRPKGAPFFGRGGMGGGQCPTPPLVPPCPRGLVCA